MIPITLRIQNFLSYGPTTQTIHFNAYKLICLSGKNGHGKSALLDAITWTIWGAARKTTNTAKADQGVMRLGQVEMMCSLDFICNKQTYRIRRVFSTKYGKPSAHVDFGTYNPETETFIPLTEKTIRKTQEVINQTLGIDYDAFINSSFLRQGQANEFSKKTPKDRKEVLASILGLNRYEKARKIAADQAKKLTLDSEYSKKLAAHIAQECEAIPALEAKKVTIYTTLQELKLQQKAHEELLKELVKQKELLLQKQQQSESLEQTCSALTTAITNSKTRFYELVLQWKRTHKTLLNLPMPETIAREKEQTLQQIQGYTQLLEQATKQKTLYAQCMQHEQQLVAQITQEQTNILHEQKITLERTKYTLETYRTQQKNLETILATLQKEHEALDAAITSIKQTTPAHYLISDTQELQAKFERYKTVYQKWIDAGNIANNELKHLNDKKKLLHDNDNPSCPLCEQIVTQARKRFLIKNVQASDTFQLHRFNKLKRLITWIKEVITEQHAALEASKKIDLLLHEQAQKRALFDTHNKELVDLQANLTQALKTQDEQGALIQTTSQMLTKTIQENSVYQELQEQKKSFEKELAQDADNQKKHAILTAQLRALEKQEQIVELATEQKKLQHERKLMIHELHRSIKNQQKELAKNKESLKNKELIKQQIQQSIAQEQQQQEQIVLVHNQQQALLQEQGACTSGLTKLYAQQKEQKKYEAQVAEYLQEAHEYTTIAHAYSKDGIQALLIEDTLPEIEQEANDILSKLTDNQTHIFIESLRDLKKGGTKETLDINISDSNGIRPYEMFSGGEAFRIDFALRIAISKLLAHRAGTSLQTLIIDEGFGSQDEDGLARIMDVIYKIQDDFEKIIIVSHLASMKDQFPIHFVIEKTSHGSTITVRELA